MKLLRLLWHALRGVGIALVALVMLIEEWGWRPLTALAARVARWPPIQRLERRIGALPPAAALGLFVVPAAALFPLKLLALWLLHQGQAALGIGLIVGAKLVGTAAVGRLFIVTEAQLVQIGWFARALGWWRATKLRLSARWQGMLRPARLLMHRLAQRWRRAGEKDTP